MVSFIRSISAATRLCVDQRVTHSSFVEYEIRESQGVETAQDRAKRKSPSSETPSPRPPSPRQPSPRPPLSPPLQDSPLRPPSQDSPLETSLRNILSKTPSPRQPLRDLLSEISFSKTPISKTTCCTGLRS